MTIYVIEMKAENSLLWTPTVNAATKRPRAEELLEEWQSRNPDDGFRLAEYMAIRDETFD